jgi:hypothetical protein
MKKILIIASLSVLFISCSKSKDLPAPTETGANKFGAKVNGEVWEARGFGPFPANDILETVRYAGGDIVIRARNFVNSPTEKEFVVFVKGVNTPGTYQLNTTTNHPTFDASYAYYVVRRFTPENEWITSSSHTGTVTFTKVDTINRIVAGNFQFQMLNWYNAPQPLNVTEGVFDLKY